MLSCSGHAYWLDSGEFVAAAVRLDVSHPPGHPLTELYGKAFTLLPLGSLPLRVAIGQAFATALACVFLCRAAAEVMKLQGLRDAVRWPCAVFAAWMSAFTYGLWFQAVRPEVYALQTLCSSVILERVASFLACVQETRVAHVASAEPVLPRVAAGAGRVHAARYAGPACFAFGLGLANHHFTALFVLPAMLVPAFELVRRGRLRCLGGAALLGLLGLATYVYLPLRAAHALPANLGHPDDWSRFAWVVSARVYQHGAATQTTQPFGERIVDVAVLLAESFRVWPLLAAVVGLYVLLRRRSTRAAGLFVFLLLAAILVARAWLGPVRSNPDVLGYFGSAFLVIGLLAASAVGELANQLIALVRPRFGPSAMDADEAAELGDGAGLTNRATGLRTRGSSGGAADGDPLQVRAAVSVEPASGAGRRGGATHWSRHLAWCLPALALINLPYALARSTLADFYATDSIDDDRLRSLPPRSIVVETMPQTVFRHWELDAVEQVRPDVAQVPVPFLTHPGMPEALLARAPSLERLVAGYLQGDLLRCRDLAAEAISRPTWLELDVRVPPACYAGLAPEHLLHRVAGGSRQLSAAGSGGQLKDSYARLYAELGQAALGEPETLRQLLAIHYFGAVQFAAVGERGLAREEIARAKRLAPEDANVIALANALDAEGEGPIAVARFLEL